MSISKNVPGRDKVTTLEQKTLKQTTLMVQEDVVMIFVEPHAATPEEVTKTTDIQIINISNHILSQEEINILQKGLKFCPTPEKQNTDELRGDVIDFTKKLRLAEMFYGTEDKFTVVLVRNKSNYTPEKTNNEYLEQYITHITNN